MHQSITKAGNADAAILARVMQPGRDEFPPEAAQAIL
jgi:hypothetical protein